MQKCAEYVRGGRRTARKDLALNQSQSESAGGIAGEDAAAARPRGTRRSWLEWKA